MKKVVILGGGFAGVRVGLGLLRKNLDLEITLVSQDPYHQYHADLYELATTFLPEEGGKSQKKVLFSNLEGTVSIPLKKIFQNKNIKLKIETVVDIDTKTRVVSLQDGEKISFDFLVFALGSVSNYFEIPNLEARSLPLKNTNDALNLRNEIDELFLRKKREEEIKIIIVGGGLTGCEFSGELVFYLENLASFHQHSKDRIKLTVIESCPVLLNGAKKWFQEKSLERLQKLGVEVVLERKIVGVEKNRNEVILESGGRLSFDLLVWTAGIRPNPLVEKVSGVKLEKNVCFAIDRFLRLVGFENIYGIGDNAFCFDYKNSCPVPPTAQLAIQQGEFVAQHIEKMIKGRQSGQFQPKLPSFVVPLGRNYALAEIEFLKITGPVAWWLKRLIAFRYFASILPFWDAFLLWRKGLRFFF